MIYVDREALDGFWYAYWADDDQYIRFGQYFINMTGYVPNGDKMLQNKLWEEKCPKKAYRIIEDSLIDTQS